MTLQSRQLLQNSWFVPACVILDSTGRVFLKRRPLTLGRLPESELFFLSGDVSVTDRIPMTQEGYNKIKAEADHLENVEMPVISEKIAAARAEGDLKENAEYHGQRETQGMLQAKINQLRTKLANSTIVDPSKIDRSVVGFGATITVLDLDIDDEEAITLVGGGEEDYDAGKYLITSPIGQGLIGKRVGEVVEIEVPKGTIQFKILNIEYFDKS